MQLRDYQQEMSDRLTTDKGDNAVTVAPTGVGKGNLIAHELKKDIERDIKSLVVVPSHSLRKNILGRLGDIDQGLIGEHKQIYIETYQSLVKRPKLKSYKRIYVDEAHIVMCNSIQGIIETNEPDQVLGYTATPRRLDGKSLYPTFNRLIPTHNVRWFIDRGYLNDYSLLTMSASKMADMLSDSYTDRLALQQEILKEKAEVANATELWREHAYGEPTFFFCAGSTQGKILVEEFSNTFPEFEFAYVDADTPKSVLDTVLDKFSKGIIKGIFNINLLILGIDVPNATCCFFLRFTYSLANYLQMIGRVLRPSDKKSIILDPYGNVLEHGHPDISRDWSLQGKQGRTKNRYCCCEGCHIPLVPTEIARGMAIDYEYGIVCKHCGDYNVFQFARPTYRRGQKKTSNSKDFDLSVFGNDTPLEGMTKVLINSRLPIQNKISIIIRNKNLNKEEKRKLLELIGEHPSAIEHHMLLVKN